VLGDGDQRVMGEMRDRVDDRNRVRLERPREVVDDDAVGRARRRPWIPNERIRLVAALGEPRDEAASDQARCARDENPHGPRSYGTTQTPKNPPVASCAVAPDEQPLRGVVVGLGVMGSHHLRVLRALSGCSVVAVVDPEDERRAGAWPQDGSIAEHSTLSEALRAHEADFACIAAPVDRLAGLAREAIDAGLAVLVEKPLAASEAEAEELIRHAEERSLLLSVGHVERFNPAVVALKEKLAKNPLGRIYQLHARRLSPYPDRRNLSGVALDLATHDLDVMRHVLGEEVVRVFAETAQRAGNEFEDLVCASLRFEDDSTGLLEVNWLTPTKVRELTVTGERGMFVVDYLTQDLRFFEHPRAAIEWEALGLVRGSDEGDMIRYAIPRREPLVVQWEAFLAAVRSGGPPPVPGREGLAALSIATAIRRAGQEHQPVVPAYRAKAAAPG
jgi:UDP-N-acetylglucosamine 3-dehydrogenase